MSTLKSRIEGLEADLMARPMRHAIYHDLPFAVFCYPPEEEWAMRNELRLLKTRLEQQADRAVVTISLAELLWTSVENSEGVATVTRKEQRDGFEAAQAQINTYLSDPDWQPLPELLLERLKPLDPDRTLVFITRAGALAPNLYRVSKLLDEMKGHIRIPCVLFMPALADAGGIRFMGIAENEGRGSYHTKVYTE